MSPDGICPGVAPNLATPTAADDSITASQNLTDYRRNIFFNLIGESMLSKSQDLSLVSIDAILSGGRKNKVARVFRVSLVQLRQHSLRASSNEICTFRLF